MVGGSSIGGESILYGSPVVKSLSRSASKIFKMEPLQPLHTRQATRATGYASVVLN